MSGLFFVCVAALFFTFFNAQECYLNPVGIQVLIKKNGVFLLYTKLDIHLLAEVVMLTCSNIVAFVILKNVKSLSILNLFGNKYSRFLLFAF